MQAGGTVSIRLAATVESEIKTAGGNDGPMPGGEWLMSQMLQDVRSQERGNMKQWLWMSVDVEAA